MAGVKNPPFYCRFDKQTCWSLSLTDFCSLKERVVVRYPFFVIFVKNKSTNMDNLIIKRSQIIEAKISGTPATNNRYFFTDIPQLSRLNIVIYGLEAFTSSQLSVSPQSSNNVVSTATGICVTLRNQAKVEFAYQIPYYTLIRANNSGLVVLFTPTTINLTDCYVQLTNTTGINANDVACFNLYYDFV